jgi:HEXXH motif-containing protein
LLISTTTPGEEEIQRLRRFAKAEQYLSDQDGEYPADTWTALGDYYLPAERPSTLLEEVMTTWREGSLFKAPRLGHIVLDAHSPGATRDYPPYFGVIDSHTSEEVELVRRRVEEGLNLIDSISRTARLTVGSSAQVISIAKSPGTLSKSGSVSTRSRIGRMGLLNLHSDVGTTPKIANAIVHESIHSLIYKLELVNSLYTDQRAAHSVQTISPWTGRTLQIHSFVHACFVWYGLLAFWNHTSSEDPGVVRMKARAQSGFREQSPLSCLSEEALEVIRPEVRDLIDEMHGRVISGRLPQPTATPASRVVVH